MKNIINCCKKKKTFGGGAHLNFDINSKNGPYSYEFEPQVKSENEKIKILLETTGQKKVEIVIDPNLTMTTLIKFYFDIINKPHLFGDPSIRFLLFQNLFFIIQQI